MKTENELIAEFMGGNKSVHPNSGLEYWFIPTPPTDGHTRESKILKYDTSWDWLMPVVKKCEAISRQQQHDLDSPGKDLDDHNGWRAWSYHEPNLSTDLKSVYEQTVEFIKWYNSQNS